MKARLATLIERGGERGRYMSGKLGDAIVVLETDGKTRDGLPRWRLMLATPEQPRNEHREAARNRIGASWRIQRRKAEGIEDLGGQD